MKFKPLHEQVIVITGASSGIGLSTALLAADRKAKLVLIARSDNTLSKIAYEINEAGGDAIAAVADVADKKQLEAAAAKAIDAYGRIDTWVNNAGISIYGTLQQTSEEDSRRLFDTNFWGVVNGSLVALKYLKVSGGTLINVGSEVSDAVIPLQGMYAASKHAVKGYTDALRVELQIEEAPVSVTLIQPTAVNTPYPQHARNYMDKEAALPTPQIEPVQVAEAILDAAINERRDVAVGSMSKINITVSKLMPRLGDKMSAQQVNRMSYDEPPRHPEGALYKPSEESPEVGHTYGSGPLNSAEKS